MQGVLDMVVCNDNTDLPVQGFSLPKGRTLMVCGCDLNVRYGIGVRSFREQLCLQQRCRVFHSTHVGGMSGESSRLHMHLHCLHRD